MPTCSVKTTSMQQSVGHCLRKKWSTLPSRMHGPQSRPRRFNKIRQETPTQRPGRHMLYQFAAFLPKRWILCFWFVQSKFEFPNGSIVNCHCRIHCFAFYTRKRLGMLYKSTAITLYLPQHLMLVSHFLHPCPSGFSKVLVFQSLITVDRLKNGMMVNQHREGPPDGGVEPIPCRLEHSHGGI